MVVGLFITLSMNIFADSDVSGMCGDDVVWNIDSNGVLFIRGDGEMYDYSQETHSPWTPSAATIKKVKILDGVTTIGDYAFKDCFNLTSISGCDFVKTIGDGAFYGCSSLEKIDGGNAVEDIGDNAFYGCSALTEITIHSSIKSIGKNAFYKCSNLSGVYITEIDKWYNIDFFDVMSNPMYYAKKIYINNKVLTELVIPDGVTEIKDNVFVMCQSLEKVTIGKDVTSIGDYAFYGCSELMGISIPDSVTSIGDYAFADSYLYNGAVIGDNVSYIGDGAFQNTRLQDVIIPDNVKYIGGHAFERTGVQVVTLGTGVEYIGTSAFYGCRSLDTVKITDIAAWCKIEFASYDSNPTYHCGKLYLNDEMVTNIEIPEGVEHIKEHTFADMKCLEKVSLPQSIISIGDSSFADCVNLESIDIGENVTSIGSTAFYGCVSLKDITIPDSVNTISYRAFYGCTGVENIVMGDGVTLISNYAFDGCSNISSVYVKNLETWCNIEFQNYESNPLWSGARLYVNDEILTKLVIPDSVTEIKPYLFCNQIELRSIQLNNNIEMVGTKAFYNCSGLKYIVLPKNICEVKQYAFDECVNIQKVFYEGSEKDLKCIIMVGNDGIKNAEYIYNATLKTYRFKTNCNSFIEDISAYYIEEEPQIENGDMYFVGWYDDSSFEGAPIVFPYYGDVTTLYALWTDKTGLSFDDAFSVEANREYAVTIKEAGQILYYVFTPQITGEYLFASKGNYDTFGYLYDENRNVLQSSDEGGENGNFTIAYNLEEGRKYYIATKLNDIGATASYTIVIETECFPNTKTSLITAVNGEKIFICTPNYIPENGTIILACYNNGKFVEMQSTKNKGEVVGFVMYKEFDTAKIMVWESIRGLTPITETEIVQ